MQFVLPWLFQLMSKILPQKLKVLSKSQEQRKRIRELMLNEEPRGGRRHASSLKKLKTSSRLIKRELKYLCNELA